MTQDRSLFELLVCPKCHGHLQTIDSPEGFACDTCNLFYALIDGIPNMLIDEAKRWPLREPEAS